MKTYSLRNGFTLIELMVTVAIVAILAAFAYPNYQKYIQRTHRTEATAALMKLQVAQEKFFLQNRRYAKEVEMANSTNDKDTPGLGIPSSVPTTNPRYTIQIPVGGAGSYTATATATGIQSNDTDCQVFTVDNTGQKSAADHSNSDTTSECWK